MFPCCVLLTRACPFSQQCAHLLAQGDIEELKKVLHPYQESNISRRRRKTRNLDLSGGLTPKHLNMLRKYLHRAPRQLTRYGWGDDKPDFVPGDRLGSMR